MRLVRDPEFQPPPPEPEVVEEVITEPTEEWVELHPPVKGGAGTTYFWVGGTGTWDTTTNTHWSLTSGGAGGAGVPGQNDVAKLDANSGAGAVITAWSGGNLNLGGLDCTGFSGTLSGSGSNSFSMYGNVTFSSTMTLSGTFNLWVGAALSVRTAGLTLPGYLSMAVAGVTHLDNFTCTGTITFSQGTWVTNSFAINAVAFTSTTTVARTMTLGSSTIALTQNLGTTFNASGATNLNFTANTATWILSGQSASVQGTLNFNGGSIVINGSGTSLIGSPVTIANLTRTAVTRWDFMQFNNNVTITGTFTINTSTVNRPIIQSQTVAARRVLTVGALVVTGGGGVDFADIQGAGSAVWSAPASGALNFGDAGGNLGISFEQSITQTWNSTGGGNWSDVTKWTTRVPLPQDDVIVNQAFVATPTILFDMQRLGRNINFTGTTGNVKVGTMTTGSPTQNSFVYGNWILVPGVVWIAGGVGYTWAGRNGNYLLAEGGNASNGKNSWSMTAPNAVYTLTMNFPFPTNAGAVSIIWGTLALGGFNMTCASFTFSANTNARILDMSGGGDLILTATNNTNVINGTTTAIIPGTGAIRIVDNGTAIKTIAGGGVMPNVIITGGGTGPINIQNATTFLSLTIGAPKTVQFPASATCSIGTLNATGASGSLITFTSMTPGTQATISVVAGVVNCNWLSLQDSNATGGAPFYAGANSTSVSNVTGWTFTAPVGKFFVGSGTNWSSTASWATSSGGASGAAVPTATDDVFLDAASPGNLTIDVAATCRTFTATNFTKTLTHNSAISLTIAGSAFVLGTGMTYTPAAVTSALLFTAASGMVIIKSAGKSLRNTTFASGLTSSTATYQLQDAFTGIAAVTITHTAGTMDTYSQPVTTGLFNSNNSNTRTINLGSSTITLLTGGTSSVWNLGTATGMTLNAGNSTIVLNGAFTGAGGAFNGGGFVYNNVSFNGTGICLVTPKNRYNTLTVGPGMTAMFRRNIITVAAPYSGAIKADSPVGYWRLGENSGTAITDEMGSPPGVYSGGYVLRQLAPGVIDSTGVAFDGISGQADLGVASAAAFTGPFSVEFWMLSTTALVGCIIGRWDSVAGGWLIRTNAGQLQIYVGPTANMVTTGPILTDGQWHHVVFEWTGGTGYVYVDGVLKNTGALATTPVASSMHLRLATYPATGQQYFAGTIDEVAVYSTVLTSAQILAHYNSGYDAHTCQTLSARGNSTSPVTFQTDIAGSPATLLVKGMGFVDSDWMALKDSNIVGPVSHAGPNSVNNGGNSGWAFDAYDGKPGFVTVS